MTNRTGRGWVSEQVVGVLGEGGEVGDAATAGEPDRRDRQRGVVAGLQVVSGSVEHGQERIAGVHGVVVGVAGHLVPRFEQGGHHQPIGGQGTRRQQLPQQLCRG